MFNKEASKNVKKVELINNNFYKQYNSISITPFFVTMINSYYEDKSMQEHLDFDERTKNYVDKVFTLKIKKQYNKLVTDLYHKGKIKIGNLEYNLKDFYIVFQKGSKDFHLMCIDNNLENNSMKYNKAIKFIDTTAFIKLISASSVNENTIILNNDNDLINVVRNWDGLLHSETSETEAINNKIVIGNDQNE